MDKISDAIWAKTAQTFKNGEPTNDTQWLSLSQHLEDTGGMAGILWDEFWPNQTKNTIITSVGSEDLSRKLYVFLSGVHDVGKCSPGFEGQVRNVRDDLVDKAESAIGMKIPEDVKNKWCRHESTGYIALRSWLIDHDVKKRTAESIATVVGGHHGVFAKHTLDVNNQILEGYKDNDGIRAYGNDDHWIHPRRSIIEDAIIRSGLDIKDLDDMDPIPLQVQSILTGMVIVADWMASDQRMFRLSMNGHANEDEQRRLITAWRQLSLPSPWSMAPDISDDDEMFHERFGMKPEYHANDLQVQATDYAREHNPDLSIIEAPMGIGKTETALMMAEEIARQRESGGLVFALPTQATANGIFSRMKEWISNVTDGDESLRLLHGGASLNPDMEKLRNEWKLQTHGDNHDSIKAPDWFNGSKQGLLSSFVVCTIDQVLMAALQQKHVMLRHAGLSGKVIIVDEVHASDDYMEVYMERALEWLASMHCPVILMSATLPSDRRESMLKAYARGAKIKDLVIPPISDHDYPLITGIKDGAVNVVKPDGGSSDKTIFIKKLEQPASDLLKDLLKDGGCAAVIRNTVRDAQSEYAEFINDGWDKNEIMLFHARFLPEDRARIENAVVKKLGKKGERPHRLVVIATQVIEASLDLDFDVMITDLAPVDLIMQRSGRLHRHDRANRPDLVSKPVLYIDGLATDPDSEIKVDKIDSLIYSESKLIRTCIVLLGKKSVKIPADVPIIVNQANSKDLVPPPAWNDELEKADRKFSDDARASCDRASIFLMMSPASRSYTMMGSNDSVIPNNDVKARAAVRDSSGDGISVLALLKHSDGTVSMFGHDEVVSTDITPENKLAMELSNQHLGLPGPLSSYWKNKKTGNMMIDDTLDELENNFIESWQQSKWLKGELVIFFDDNGDTAINGYRLHYDQRTGLSYEKEES